MDKLDVLMFILGFSAYLAIMLEFKANQRKLSLYDALQEKKRLYFEKLKDLKYQDELREKDKNKDKNKNKSEKDSGLSNDEDMSKILSGSVK